MCRLAPERKATLRVIYILWELLWPPKQPVDGLSRTKELRGIDICVFHGKGDLGLVRPKTCVNLVAWMIPEVLCLYLCKCLICLFVQHPWNVQ